MMLCHRPVLLGIFWILLCNLSASVTSQGAGKETHEVYSYTYHFQHNGTTNSKDIIKRVLSDPEFGPEPALGKSIVRTFSNPNIRGFFSKGFLPATPQYLSSPPRLQQIRKTVPNNIDLPVSNPILSPVIPSVPKPVLPPVISQPLYSGYGANKQNELSKVGIPINTVNDVHPDIGPENKAINLLQHPEEIIKDLPKNFISHNPLQNLQNVARDPPFFDFKRIRPVNNNGLVSKVETFERNIPGGKVVGKIETVSYNSPPHSNSVSSYQGFTRDIRQKTESINQNQQRTSHRSYFRQNFRTLNPHTDYKRPGIIQNFDVNRNNNNNKNDRSWWTNFGKIENQINQIHHQNLNNNVQSHNRISAINDRLQSNLNNHFGQRLNVNNRFTSNNLATNHNNYNYHLHNVEHVKNNNNYFDTPYVQHNNNNNFDISNNNFNGNRVEKKAEDIINDVKQRLNDVHNRVIGDNKIDLKTNDSPFTWDDDNANWSPNNYNNWNDPGRHAENNHVIPDHGNFGIRRQFSNAHSGPINSHPNLNKPADPPKPNLDALVERISSFFNSRTPVDNYKNTNGGGIERVYGSDMSVRGPNSFSRNRERGYERTFEVNSGSGYQSASQWPYNSVRRLDVQSTKDDFNKDFIDVFKDHN